MAKAAADLPTARAVLERAALALGKIDRDGLRGLTTLSTVEIEAMALALVGFGLIAVQRGQRMPERLVVAKGGCDVVAS